MKYLQSLLLILFSLFSYFSFLGLESASSSFSAYENQVFDWSSQIKIKKIQEVFKWLGLYDWVVDWKFSSIEWTLLSYQKKAWIIVNNNDYWAGYFWNKTIVALERDYPNTFPSLKEEYLKIDEPSSDERYFYVTAYYSPLPGQSRYTTWSYSWDKRLNWEWKTTASWKWVFTWLMAWPRNYSYWTKIYLDWIGVWSVEDRWWAIVNAWERWFEYDRIDIWMWYWDEWLERALKWWKRKVKWYVVDEDREISIEFDESPVVKFKNLKVDAENPKKENVKKLQLLLKDLDLYNWSINWDYESVRNILIKFQLEKWVISSKYSESAWYFWPKTYAAFRKNFWWWFFIERHIEPWDNIALSNKKKVKVRKLKSKLDSYLDKKYNWNSYKINKNKRKLKEALDWLISSSNSITKKNELKYLKAIL